MIRYHQSHLIPAYRKNRLFKDRSVLRYPLELTKKQNVSNYFHEYLIFIINIYMHKIAYRKNTYDVLGRNSRYYI